MFVRLRVGGEGRRGGWSEGQIALRRRSLRADDDDGGVNESLCLLSDSGDDDDAAYAIWAKGQSALRAIAPLPIVVQSICSDNHASRESLSGLWRLQTMVVREDMATDGVGQYPCTLPFAFECRESNCCESYHSRFVIAIFVFGLLFIALTVAALWFFLQIRPTLRFIIFTYIFCLYFV